MPGFYWERHPEGPFVTLIRVTTNYLHPENYDLDDLKALARRDRDDEMQVFKSEVREALRDPARLPGAELSDSELSDSVQYDNGSDVAFLRWLWYELYGDEPFEASTLTRLEALPEPFGERLESLSGYDVSKAVRAGDWGKALELVMADLAESGAPVSPAEREELAMLLTVIGQPPAAVPALTVSTALPGATARSAHPLLQHRLPPC